MQALYGSRHIAAAQVQGSVQGTLICGGTFGLEELQAKLMVEIYVAATCFCMIFIIIIIIIYYFKAGRVHSERLRMQIRRPETTQVANYLLDRLGKGQVTAELLQPDELISGMMAQVAAEPDMAQLLTGFIYSSEGDCHLARVRQYINRFTCSMLLTMMVWWPLSQGLSAKQGHWNGARLYISVSVVAQGILNSNVVLLSKCRGVWPWSDDTGIPAVSAQHVGMLDCVTLPDPQNCATL